MEWSKSIHNYLSNFTLLINFNLFKNIQIGQEEMSLEWSQVWNSEVDI